ncbi:G-type lectin S-receptor-like serine/threonine-protein kinase At1g11300 isoform X2 [Quercus suber]|uniref:G-type lectin S-receptor-like serine/threonine-protein kinase At1g11300 isoform X2 n=1 Tax=Quercus suber TaxID=58331 RepID=UPI0032DE830B
MHMKLLLVVCLRLINIDTQQLSSCGVELYICAAYSELDKVGDVKKTVTITDLQEQFSFPSGLTYRGGGWQSQKRRNTPKFLGDNLDQVKVQDLPLFNFEKLASATNNFHLSNRLGQGGFGPLYRGKLSDGQEIAVKRISKTSGQGLQEFMNGVVVISKLQHRNLVRLLGCCVEGEEKMLIYEFMLNKALDAFLFDSWPHGQ